MDMSPFGGSGVPLDSPAFVLDLVYCLSRSVAAGVGTAFFIRRLRKRESMEQSCFRITLFQRPRWGCQGRPDRY